MISALYFKDIYEAVKRQKENLYVQGMSGCMTFLSKALMSCHLNLYSHQNRFSIKCHIKSSERSTLFKTNPDSFMVAISIRYSN